MTVIVKTVQTCFACPSQWDAYDEDGNYWYFRFRHGYGEASNYGQEHESESRWNDFEPIESFEFEHPELDGVIDLEEFCKWVPLTLADDVEST